MSNESKLTLALAAAKALAKEHNRARRYELANSIDEWVGYRVAGAAVLLWPKPVADAAGLPPDSRRRPQPDRCAAINAELDAADARAEFVEEQSGLSANEARELDAERGR